MSPRCTQFEAFDPRRVPSPCFVIDRAAVEANLRLLADVQRESGARILAALKAFSCWSLGPLTGRYLSGICASGLHEALLGQEHYGGEVHVYSAAYPEADLRQLLGFADHLVFNSFPQWHRFRAQVEDARKKRPELRLGLRVNPEHSEGAVPLYDPCAPGSRLGIPRAAFAGESLAGISGLHFHSLCEQGFAPLARTLDALEARFGDLLASLEWLNLGGGHLITAADYDRQALVARLQALSRAYDLQLYLEPGEALAIGSGVLVTEVLDVCTTDRPQAILDSSATCHLPDTLEMPYKADILGAQDADAPGSGSDASQVYELGGLSCLAGDRFGRYAFAKPLQPGDRLLFDDMAHYTLVKTSTFNGVRLPAIALWDARTDELELVREFGYPDFRNRLS